MVLAFSGNFDYEIFCTALLYKNKVLVDNGPEKKIARLRDSVSPKLKSHVEIVLQVSSKVSHFFRYQACSRATGVQNRLVPEYYACQCV